MTENLTENERQYEVPDISCDHCKNTIEGGLAELDGVSGVVVDVDTRRVTVTGTAGDAEIRSELEELGYPVSAG